MSSQMWLAISNGLKNLRATASLQSRFLGVQADTASSKSQKPKKPLSPYFRFMVKVRPDLAQQHPELKFKDLIKLIGQKWTKLDEASKEHYSSAFQAEMGPYTKLLAKYNESLPQEVKDQEGQLKLEKQLKRERRERRQRLDSLGKPKKPATPFLQFIKAKFTPDPGKGREHAKDQLKELSVKWKALSDSDKTPYVAQYEKDAAAFKTAITKWEDQMIKLGNNDVVRADRLPPKTKEASPKKQVKA